MFKISVIFFILSLGLTIFIVCDTPKQPVLRLNQSMTPIFKPSIINEINQQNAKIHSFTAKLKIESNLCKLTGTIYFEKNKRFRLRTESILGLEGDIGSNDNYFWFWSKRMNPPSLYYARHEDYSQTRLKAPFNPIWMMECLSISEIPQTQLYTQEKYYAAKHTSNNINKITLLDPKLKTIVGHYLCDRNNNVIASAKIIDFQRSDRFLIPKKIEINWFDENISLIWTIYDVKINSSINETLWNIPNYSRTIDMSRMP